MHWCAVYTNAVQYFGYFWWSFYRVNSFKIAKFNELRQIYTLIGSVWTCTIEKLSPGSKYDLYIDGRDGPRNTYCPQSWRSTGVQNVHQQYISGVQMPYSAVWQFSEM